MKLTGKAKELKNQFDQQVKELQKSMQREQVQKALDENRMDKYRFDNEAFKVAYSKLQDSFVSDIALLELREQLSTEIYDEVHEYIMGY
tara:strand:+ start:30 stop:296 length:267 start_codon:yes stop_codon:yes gene_type:complete